MMKEKIYDLITSTYSELFELNLDDTKSNIIEKINELSESNKHNTKKILSTENNTFKKYIYIISGVLLAILLLDFKQVVLFNNTIAIDYRFYFLYQLVLVAANICFLISARKDQHSYDAKIAQHIKDCLNIIDTQNDKILKFVSSINSFHKLRQNIISKWTPMKDTISFAVIKLNKENHQEHLDLLNILSEIDKELLPESTYKKFQIESIYKASLLNINTNAHSFSRKSDEDLKILSSKIKLDTYIAERQINELYNNINVIDGVTLHDKLLEAELSFSTTNFQWMIAFIKTERLIFNNCVKNRLNYHLGFKKISSDTAEASKYSLKMIKYAKFKKTINIHLPICISLIIGLISCLKSYYFNL